MLAGAVGVEPTQLVLETNVLPLYDAPVRKCRTGDRRFTSFWYPPFRRVAEEATTTILVRLRWTNPPIQYILYKI